MFKGFISLMLVLGFQWTVQASDRCEPVRDAMPSRLSCNKRAVVLGTGGGQMGAAGGQSVTTDVFYTVVINTKMSLPGCGDQHQEVSRATITVSTEKTGVLATIELQPGTFEYSAGSSPVYLSAPLLGLELNDCVAPVHGDGGGFSFGN